MKTSTLLVEQQQRLVSLLAFVTENVATRLARTPEVIDAAMAQLAMEEAALDERRVAASIDADRHRAAHLRARLALFRVAASPTDSAGFLRSIHEIAEIFRDRSRELGDALESLGDETAIRRINVELARLLGAFRSPSCGDYLVAYAMKRSAVAIERCA